MQIVIDIPDGYVKVIMVNQRTEGTAMDKLLRQAVIDGTPLPKGHGRLIDADALGEKEEYYLNKDESISFFYVYSEYIIDAPTIVEADKEE